MKVMFDSSVIVAALVTSHQSHTACILRLNQALQQDIQGVISTHSLAEIYSVMTRLPLQPPIRPQLAQRQLTTNLQNFEFVPLLVEDYQAAIAQMVSLNLPGGGIFDALIAQAALKANVDQLLTLNPKHFNRLSETVASLVQVPQ
ncbi:MAG: PIN domain-containing protein [Calothrix sp. FI2-JRJ7]|jgi:predicted nucleic acid-binding protein|nr:PIN domain-containing protein [Calothrix sp. FI2-JRJ7]